MGATYRKRGKRSWIVTVHHAGAREFKTVHSEQDARDLVKFVHKQELAGVNVVEAVRAARTLAPAAKTWPTLREALPPFIEQMTARGEWTGGTPHTYTRRLSVHVYDFPLPDGRLLGDVPVDQVTEHMIGAVLDNLRTGDSTRKARSLALQEQIRSPLRRYFREQIKKHGQPGPNPAADLKDYMRKGLSKRARVRNKDHFRHDEGRVLFETCAACFPRWLPFIGCCTLAGLRWGEAAALTWDDVDWKQGILRVRRSICDRTGQVKDTKDHEARFVPLSPQLGEWLRQHQEAMTLEAQVKDWGPEQRARVFPNTVGRIGRHSTFMEHVWRPLLKKAKLPYRKPHTMRDTFITWAANGDESRGVAPVPLHVVAEWAGHASVQETEGYLHRQPGIYARGVHALDAYVTG